MSFATTPYRPSHLALAYTQVYSFYTRKLRFISLENLEFLLLFSQESTTPLCEGNSTSVLYVFSLETLFNVSHSNPTLNFWNILQLSLTGTWHLESKKGSFSEKKSNMLLELCWFRFLQNNIILCLNLSLPIFINVGLLLGISKRGKLSFSEFEKSRD